MILRLPILWFFLVLWNLQFPSFPWLPNRQRTLSLPFARSLCQNLRVAKSCPLPGSELLQWYLFLRIARSLNFLPKYGPPRHFPSIFRLRVGLIFLAVLANDPWLASLPLASWLSGDGGTAWESTCWDLVIFMFSRNYFAGSAVFVFRLCWKSGFV